MNPQDENEWSGGAYGKVSAEASALYGTKASSHRVPVQGGSVACLEWERRNHEAKSLVKSKAP